VASLPSRLDEYWNKRPKGEAAMSEHEPGDKEHLHESALLHGQEHKGYGEDEGERDESLEPEGHEPEPDAAV
jgi:hypothetical protein